MIQSFFLTLTLLGSEWVLVLLVLLSVLSLSLILERGYFYRKSSNGLIEFRDVIRKNIQENTLADALDIAHRRKEIAPVPDLETEMTVVLLEHLNNHHKKISRSALEDLASDAMSRARLKWEKYLTILATIGANTPFLGLLGTVLGIIRAFHDLSAEGAQGATGVSSGIAEALVATAVGLFVAIPAVVGYNFYSKKIKSSLTEADAQKNYIIGSLLKD